jgi:hypothetical protein
MKMRFISILGNGQLSNSDLVFGWRMMLGWPYLANNTRGQSAACKMSL